MKTILKVLAVIVGVLLIGFLVLSLTLDGIIKSKIEEVGSELLKTEVNVSDVSVSLLNSRGHIDGIVVENPEGFSDSAAVKLQSINISLDLLSTLSDTLVIDTLVIEQPEVYMEQHTGGNNLGMLQENLAESSTDESGGLIIDYLLIEDGVITASTDIGGERSAQVEFGRFEQEGIGRAESNTVKSSIQEILEPILERAVREAIKGGVREEVEDRIKNLLEG